MDAQIIEQYWRYGSIKELYNVQRVLERKFQQLLKTQVILILNFTQPHGITHSNKYTKHKLKDNKMPKPEPYMA